MTYEKFEELLRELDGNSSDTLIAKNKMYSAGKGPLHNFESGSDISGMTTAQTCWGYLTKHLVALRDYIESDNFDNREDVLEKCQDIINYIRFIWAIANDKG